MNKQECIEYIKELGGIETKQGWNVPKGVDLHNQNLTEIPIKFNIVNGYFYCDNNELTSLKNCPKEVKGDFHCAGNRLTSLKYSPKIVKGNFYCSNNKLASFKYAPKEVRCFYCDKGSFIGKEYYKLLLDEKVISESEYLLRIL